ncbi:MAG: peptidase domain-containing ABC transporter [Legionellales bacterium]|nr:peptidase domain-containing ABC transporter [Legionellales bacterium]
MQFWQTVLRFRKKAKLPMILQEEMAECAHACIAMIVNFWGCKLSLSTLRGLHHTSVRGVNVLQMSQIFDRLGFKTRVLRVPFQDLGRVKTPAILHWNHQHFVVLKKVQRQKIVIHDPALGVRHYKKLAASERYSGVVLEVETTEHLSVGNASPKLTIWTLLKSILGMPRILGMLLLLSVVIESMQIINPMFMQYVTDYVVGSNALTQMYRIGLGCTLFILLQGLTEFLRSHLILYTSIQITQSFAAEVFKHILKLPLRYFAHRHLSDIQSRFQFIDQLKTKLSTDFMHTFLDGLMILVTLTVMLLYSPILTGMIASMLVIYAVALYWNMRTYKHQASSALSLHAKSAVTFHEALRGIAPVKSFLKEHVWFQLWRNDYIDALNHDVQIAQIQISYRVLNQVLYHMEYVLVICVGAGLVLSQRLSIGMLLAFLAYRMILVNKSAAFIQYLFAYQGLTLQLQRLQDLLEHEPEIIHIPTQQPAQMHGALHVQSVAFSYPGQAQTLLKAISFSIEPGEKIAIVGPSGCGKTTLLKIMMGFEQPTSGAILLDDIPLPLFGLQNFRQMSASVMQDDVLFTGSILDNITFFAEEIDMDSVYEVAKLTCIHDTIVGLPMGYDSLIGQTQSSISGGQRQRILLARALYKKPQFLFLDEATSHLDMRLEHTINQALQACRMTQIMVAHRPDTIAMADRVIELV